MDSNAKLETEALPTTSTSRSNDPMCQAFEMEGFLGLEGNKNVSPCYFAVTLEGLQGLIDETYEAIVAVDRRSYNLTSTSFRHYVSLSMFSYYIWQHAYARLLAIKVRNSKGPLKEQDHLTTFASNERYFIPSVISDYLCSIGNIVDQASVQFQLDFPVWPNEEGHYGRVSADTHYMYESLAAPAVVAQRMIEDVACTFDPLRSCTWNLPANLRPDEDTAGLPTRNLLGWAESTVLTESQLSYSGSHIFNNGENFHFHSTIPQFQFNPDLFDSISRIVRNAYTKIKVVSSLDIRRVNGSIAQTQWQSVDPYWSFCSRFSSGEDSKQYTEGMVYQSNHCMEDIQITLGALICAFRVQKEPDETRRYSCYDFHYYTQVPDAWHETRNTIFNYGKGYGWNLNKFESLSKDKGPIRAAWIRKTLITHEDKKPLPPEFYPYQ